MSDLLEKGIEISPLLSSKVFCQTFDFDEWPSTHTNQDDCTKPFNASYFDLRYSYIDIFWEDEFLPMEENDDPDSKVDSSKVFKISYQINMLPMLDMYVQEDCDGNKMYINDSTKFLEKCIDSGDLDIFDVENFQTMVLFKWDSYGFNVVRFSFFMHLVYMGLLTAYNIIIYIEDVQDKNVTKLAEIVLIGAVWYPAMYDLI